MTSGLRRETWPYWAVGLVFGAMVGLPVASFGFPMLVVGVAFVALAYAAARSLAFLSGAIAGIGGIWLGLLIRAQMACEAFDDAPNQGCQSLGMEPWVVLSVIVLGVGLVLGAIGGDGTATGTASSAADSRSHLVEPDSALLPRLEVFQPDIAAAELLPHHDGPPRAGL